MQQPALLPRWPPGSIVGVGNGIGGGHPGKPALPAGPSGLLSCADRAAADRLSVRQQKLMAFRIAVLMLIFWQFGLEHAAKTQVVPVEGLEFTLREIPDTEPVPTDRPQEPHKVRLQGVFRNTGVEDIVLPAPPERLIFALPLRHDGRPACHEPPYIPVYSELPPTASISIIPGDSLTFVTDFTIPSCGPETVQVKLRYAFIIQGEQMVRTVNRLRIPAGYHFSNPVGLPEWLRR
jgi:hypothetical protein